MTVQSAGRECRIEPGTGFTINFRDTAEWDEAGLRAFLRYRDTGVAATTGGRISIRNIVATGAVEMKTGWHCHDLDFQYVYVLNGHVRFEAEGQGEIVLRTGDGAHLPPFTMHDETEFADDFEVLEITMPAHAETLTEKPQDRGSRPQSRFATSYLRSDSFVTGGGPRDFLAYRDFGVAAATANRVGLQALRANGAADAGTGWHYHTLDAQIVYLLSGGCRAELDVYGAFELRAGDALSIPAGHRHSFSGFSEDFEMLGLNVPAKFETFPAAMPE